MFDFPNSPAVNQAVTGPGGAVYVWDGAKWLASAGANASVVANNVGRNLITNGTFVVAQRGTGPWTQASSSYTADRWQVNFGGTDTYSTSVVALADADRTAIGDESALSALQNAFVGGSQYIVLNQRIEGVRRLANKTCTISFWARASSGTPRIGMGYQQSFGSGGSPSSTVGNNIGVTAALTATWQRFSFSFAMPSASGKTFGTTVGSDFIQLDFWFSCTAAISEAGGIGTQSGTIQLWGVQLEIGSVATPLDAGGTSAQILAEAQRFYQYFPNFTIVGYGAAGSTMWNEIIMPVSMRATPTFGLANVTYGGVGGGSNLVLQTAFPQHARLSMNVANTGINMAFFDMSISADL